MHSLQKVFLLIIRFNLLVFVFAANLTDFPQLHKVELDDKYWEGLAKTEIFEAYHREDNQRKAKNVIIFVGGGMGLSTITSARILKGQLQGSSGEEGKLSFENFPNACLIKTYTVDNQVPDSAGTATALLSGVKTNNGVTGVNARVKMGKSDCKTVHDNIVASVFDLAHDQGMSTGIVTTTRLTEATAAGTYASTANKEWEGFIPLKFAHHPTHPQGCKDIARQLIENHPGKNFNVILGGGGQFFYPKNVTDPISGKTGQRKDGLNLINQWIANRKEQGLLERNYSVVRNREQLLAINDKNHVNYLLGIFNGDTMSYDLERDPLVEPSLVEMTDSAIKLLQRNEQGFLLVIESGQIDIAHHSNYANMALHETLAFDKAVERALQLVSIEDTLIIVTADHSQAMTMSGNSPRGHNILGTTGYDDETNMGFTTLIYSNGPGYKKNRNDPKLVDTSALRYKNHAGVYLDSSHHTGEDVALYSIGPMSFLFHGTKEQSFVAHAVAFAACMGGHTNQKHCVEFNSTSRFSHSSAITPDNTSTCLLLFEFFNLSLILFRLLKV